MLSQGQVCRSAIAHNSSLIVPQPCRYRSHRGWVPRAGSAAAAAAEKQQQSREPPVPPRILLPGLDDEIALTREPAGPGFIPDELPSTPWVRPPERTFTEPSIRASGTLRPGPEWFPAWMQYRRREDNYVFWKDMLMRCSLDIPDAEKRWTVLSSVWWLVMEFKYFAVPASFRYVWWIVWRAIMQRVYQAHKAVVLWQSKVDAALAARATNSTSSSSSSSGGISSSTAPSSSGEGIEPRFSRAMALRRLHWKNTLLGELLYLVNVAKTGRVLMLPPIKRPLQRPTFFFLF